MKTLIQTLFFLLLVTQICFAQWYQQNNPTTQNLNAVTFIDINNGFAVGDSGIIIHTTDGGVNWTIIPSGTTLSLTDICFTDFNNGYIVGDMDGGGIILKTTSGGETWTQSFMEAGGLRAVCFIDSNNVWAVGWTSGMEGSYQYVVKTTDGGTIWIELGYFGGFIKQGYLNDVFFINDSTGIAVGEFYPNGGNIIKTIDGGDTWVEIHSSSEEIYYSVFGLSESTWFVVGTSDIEGGIVMLTSDGGTTWESANSPQSSGLNSIYFSDFNNGTAVGYASVLDGRVPLIYQTTDSGISWLEQLNPEFGGSLMDVFFIGEREGWTVGLNVLGGNHTIFHTTNGGVSFVEENEIDEIPSDYRLTQNFPNPFNPSTKIRYSIPKSSNVVIKVFDILGNEIETLISEEKSAGTYELTWNAATLPSGVYFYQLKAGSFVETKKMILMK